MLDNGVGRPLLGRLATARASQLLRGDVEIGYDEVWHHRVGSYFVPDGPRFNYYEPTVLAWKDELPISGTQQTSGSANTNRSLGMSSSI